MTGYATRLGFIIPSTNFIVEPDVYSMLPPGVTAHFARVLVTGRDIDRGYSSIWKESNERIDLAVQELASARVSVIAYAVTAGSFFGGREWDATLRAHVAHETGIPCVSTSYSLVLALNALRASHVAVASAYAGLLNHHLRTFLTEHHFKIVGLQGLGDTVIQQPASESPERIMSLAREVNSPEAEAILLSCAGLSVLPLLDGLEEELRKPVVSSNQAVVWAALRAAKVNQQVQGFGRLLASR